MRLARLAPLIGLVLIAGSVPAPSAPSPEPLVDWIAGLQAEHAGRPSDGALVLGAGPAFYHDGRAYRHVVPYFSNLALTAVLDAAPSPRAHRMAERWVAWWLAHPGPRGVPVEHWVAGDGAETACPARLDAAPAVDRCDAVDATDSAAATFLDLVRAYHASGGAPGPLAAWRGEVRAQGRVLLALQDADGLTWARDDYRVKYLMDNAETVRGLRALAALEREAYRDPARARRADAAADRAAAGVASMRDPATGLYAWARHPGGAQDAPDMGRWYADAVAQVWPLLFDAAPGRDAVAGYRRFDRAYDGAARADWTAAADPSGFDWPAVGVAAVRAGDRGRAAAQVRSLWARRVDPPGGAPFAHPFTVADAGWLLRAVVATGR